VNHAARIRFTSVQRNSGSAKPAPRSRGQVGLLGAARAARGPCSGRRDVRVDRRVQLRLEALEADPLERERDGERRGEFGGSDLEATRDPERAVVAEDLA
jgi:hypothetical protein